MTLNESAKNNAIQATGCEIRFNLEGPEAVIALQSPEGPTLAEVYQGDFFSALHIVDATPTRITVSRPESERTCARSRRPMPGSIPASPGWSCRGGPRSV